MKAASVLDSNIHINNDKLIDTKNVYLNDELKNYRLFNNLFKRELRKKIKEFKKVKVAFNSFNLISFEI